MVQWKKQHGNSSYSLTITDDMSGYGLVLVHRITVAGKYNSGNDERFFFSYKCKIQHQ